MTWTEIAEKHGTDKASHGYMPHYDARMPFRIDRMLEIGCLKGASLRMWRELYPEAEIHCLDLFEEHQPPDDIGGVTYWKGSQTDHYVLEQIRRLHFDVIIDDGSHNSRDQLITFWSLWGCCDKYIMEDLHCCKDELYRQGLPFEKTMLGQMQSGTFPFRHYLYDNKIAFIYAD